MNLGVGALAPVDRDGARVEAVFGADRIEVPDHIELDASSGLERERSHLEAIECGWRRWRLRAGRADREQENRRCHRPSRLNTPIRCCLSPSHHQLLHPFRRSFREHSAIRLPSPRTNLGPKALNEGGSPERVFTGPSSAPSQHAVTDGASRRRTSRGARFGPIGCCQARLRTCSRAGRMNGLPRVAGDCRRGARNCARARLVHVCVCAGLGLHDR